MVRRIVTTATWRERPSSSQRNYAARKRSPSGRNDEGEAGGKRDYTWRGERQLILTFLSENQSVVIPEAAYVISSLPHSAPSPSLRFALPELVPWPFGATPISTFPIPYRAFPIRLIHAHPPIVFLFAHHARAANLLLIAATKHPACEYASTYKSHNASVLVHLSWTVSSNHRRIMAYAFFFFLHICHLCVARLLIARQRLYKL